MEARERFEWASLVGCMISEQKILYLFANMLEALLDVCLVFRVVVLNVSVVGEEVVKSSRSHHAAVGHLRKV